MNTFEAVENLRSFRSAKGSPIEREKIGKVLEAGRMAPSPGNVQTMEFIVVESEELRIKLAEAASDRRLEESPTLIILLSDIERMRRRVGERCNSACKSEASCSAHNMRLVALEQGLSTCWITDPDDMKIRAEFDIPDSKSIEGIVALCYSDDEVEPEEKFSLNEVTYYEEYNNQISSVFDGMEWEGLHESIEGVSKRGKGFFWRLKRKIGSIL